MLEGSIVFNLSGSVKNSSLPNLVVGDKNSVKLKVKWLAHESLPVFANLTNYVVEGVYTRPDGKVSPALTFSIDNENDETKYLIFGSWLTEIAGIATLTVRFKQNDEIKATGQISLVIQDGSTPADVVITEPQHEALQESIQAEENARKQAILGLQNELAEKEEAINNSIEFLNNEIEKETNARVDAIRNEREDRENGDLDLNDKIDYTDNRVDNIADSMRSIYNQLQNTSNIAQNAASKAIANEGTIQKKLNKVFDVSDANDIAEEDYFVINSGGNAYRITLAQLKEKIGNEGETVINNYLGDFNSEAELKGAYPVAQEGNFAYVKGEDEIYAMYLWVDEDDKSGWYKSTSGKYVKTTTFDSFKEQLQNGEINVGSIVANIIGDGNEELLQTLKVNGKNYSLPSVSLEISDEEIPSAPTAKSITINGDSYNFGGGSGGVSEEFVNNAIANAIGNKLTEDY
jgi:hypothetical protein